MALSFVEVPDVKIFGKDADGNRLISSGTFQVQVDDDFQIDGVSMPTPHDARVSVNIMTQDAKRLPGNGEMIAPYAGTAFNITWKYKMLNAAQYKLLYDALITGTVNNKNVFHTIKTVDYDSGAVIEKTIYVQATFDSPIYMIRDGIRYFRDVTLTMVDKAGEV